LTLPFFVLGPRSSFWVTTEEGPPQDNPDLRGSRLQTELNSAGPITPKPRQQHLPTVEIALATIRRTFPNLFTVIGIVEETADAAGPRPLMHSG
jgi:hypothetical protein